jgi:hypothetical protein
MAKQKESKGEVFSIREFLDRMNAIGDIPVTLAYWELTGDSRQVREMFKK